MVLLFHGALYPVILLWIVMLDVYAVYQKEMLIQFVDLPQVFDDFWEH